MLRWITSGESHGKALVGTIDGLPAGIEIEPADIARALKRRRWGYGRGARMSFEQDELEILGGVRHGRSLGSPVSLVIGNSEWPKWTEVMAVSATDEEGRRYDEPGRFAGSARAAALTRPRPGHADLASMLKYGFDDIRPVLERASARETATRVALGEIAAQFLAQALDVRIVSHVVGCGSVATPDDLWPVPEDAAADAGGDRPPPRGRRHARRRRRGARLRPPAGGRQLRARRPAPGRRARRGHDGHPGHQGHGVRRRLHHRHPAGLTGARRDREGRRARRQARDPPPLRPRRRHRGRHDHGRGPALPGRAQADLLRAAGAVDRRRGLARTGHRDQPAQRRVRDRADRRRRGYVAALTIARAVLEKFGGDSVAEVRRNVQGYVDGLGVVLD